jgi:hypothetical protein
MPSKVIKREVCLQARSPRLSKDPRQKGAQRLKGRRSKKK